MSRPPLQIAARAARKPPPRPKTAKVRLSDLPPNSVREPGKAGHGGTWDNAWGTDKVREDWRTAAGKVNHNEDARALHTRQARNVGRQNYGVSAGMVLAGAGGGVAMDRIGNRQAARIKAGKYDRGIMKPVRKKVEPSMLFVRQAEKVKGAHVVTSMAPKPTREQRFAEWSARHPNGSNIAAGASVVGGTAFVAGTATGDAKMQDARKKRRAQLRRTGNTVAVGKKLQGRLVVNAVRHPSEMRRVIRENPWEAGIAVGGAGLAGAAGARDKRHPNRTAAASVGGAAAGQLGYYGVGFGAIARSEKLKRAGQKQGHNGLSRSAQESIWRKHRLGAGVHQGEKMTTAQQRSVFQNYPRELPGWRTQRLAAHMQRGKYGRAILAGATLGGAAMVGGASAMGRKQHVGKALYAREDRVSIIRSGELAAGGTLVAYGFGNSGMVGRGLARGVKIAQRNGNEQAAEALQRAAAARGSIRAGMAPGEAALRRIHAVDSAIRKVPKPLRAEVALVAGALLGARAMPIRRTHYTPVSTPVPAYGRSW